VRGNRRAVGARRDRLLVARTVVPVTAAVNLQIGRRPPQQPRIVVPKSVGAVAVAAQELAHALGQVAVIDDQLAVGPLADGAGTALAREHGVVVRDGDSVDILVMLLALIVAPVGAQVLAIDRIGCKFVARVCRPLRLVAFAVLALGRQPPLPAGLVFVSVAVLIVRSHLLLLCSSLIAGTRLVRAPSAQTNMTVVLV
jgi:hypothetical protein